VDFGLVSASSQGSRVGAADYFILFSAVSPCFSAFLFDLTLFPILFLSFSLWSKVSLLLY
jgi:hypothetical protein